MNEYTIKTTPKATRYFGSIANGIVFQKTKIRPKTK